MEDVALFSTETIRLSGHDSKGRPLTANVYTLEGVTNDDGSLRQMSIGQLCMAICLQRASTLETELIKQMNTLADNSNDLEFLSDIENKATASETSGEKTIALTGDEWTRLIALAPSIETNGSATYNGGDGTLKINNFNQFCTDLEDGMDSLNTTSQELLITIETLTAKRDDTYTLVSNITKSCYQTLSGIVANV